VPAEGLALVKQAVKMAKSSWHVSLDSVRMMKRRNKTLSLLRGVKRQKFLIMCELGEQSGCCWTESSLLLFLER